MTGQRRAFGRPYEPLPMDKRMGILQAYHTPEDQRTPAQQEALDNELQRTNMTAGMADRLYRGWVRRGFAPFSAMDIAELEQLKRTHGSLENAAKRLA